MGRFLTILEVSQKQKYIFASNKVRDNIVNSASIAYVLSDEYLSKVFNKKNISYDYSSNMVSSGGGHTILEFGSDIEAKEATMAITESAMRDFQGLEIFAKTIEYDESIAIEENMKKLTAELEKKKSLRNSAFKQGSYGIEAIDSATLAPKYEVKSETVQHIEKNEYITENKAFVPERFAPVNRFEDLGGSKGDNNFIAVVHIDGNGMGKRVEEIYETIKNNNMNWEVAKKTLREFSDAIDEDFKAAFKEMCEVVGKNIDEKKLIDLGLKNNNFPVRRIITAGDDICFVSEGRIGLECARVFIKKLSVKVNRVDKKSYAACAGVAIVHVKFPFYKAYELAEELCSSAKRYGASISPEDNGSSVSSIDWHIEFGELKDTLEDIREDYVTEDDNQLTFRPYIINTPKKLNNITEYKNYSSFKNKIVSIINDRVIGKGKIKEMRPVLKEGEVATSNYIAFNKMNTPLFELPFIDCDEVKHCTLFDAIELMDTFIALED